MEQSYKCPQCGTEQTFLLGEIERLKREVERWVSRSAQQTSDLGALRHKHRGSVAVDRGETCLDCGLDMNNPIHAEPQTEERK